MTFRKDDWQCHGCGSILGRVSPENGRTHCFMCGCAPFDLQLYSWEVDKQGVDGALEAAFLLKREWGTASQILRRLHSKPVYSKHKLYDEGANLMQVQTFSDFWIEDKQDEPIPSTTNNRTP